MKNIAVMGAQGFVGRAICNEIMKFKDFNLIRVIRSDDLQNRIQQADVVIHCANSSKRFYANNNPKEDFIDTVEKMKTVNSLLGERKLILISTVSARLQLNTPYGRNRRSCELMVNTSKNLIIRLGPMYAKQNQKGALFDIIKNQKVYVNEKTKYAYTNVSYNAQKIIELLDKTGIIEIGAKNAISLGYLKKEIGSTSLFEGRDDTQIILSDQNDAPDAFGVIPFARKIKKMINKKEVTEVE